jgi:hypothetical protein
MNTKQLGFISAGSGLLATGLLVYGVWFQSYVFAFFPIPFLLSLVALIIGGRVLNNNASDKTDKLLGSIGVITGLPILCVFLFFMGYAGI